MFCFTITYNGEPLCTAGCADASFLDVMVSGSVFDEAPASLRITGMKELPNDRLAHVYWVEELALNFGDILEIKPQELSESTVPVSVVPTDSPDYIAEQQSYQEFLGAHIWPQPAPLVLRRTVSLKLTHPRTGQLNTSIPMGQQHILCTVLWNNLRARPTRIYARSFSEGNSLEWLREDLYQDETLRIEVCA